jgi:hypothetical protein
MLHRNESCEHFLLILEVKAIIVMVMLFRVQLLSQLSLPRQSEMNVL